MASNLLKALESLVIGVNAPTDSQQDSIEQFVFWLICIEVTSGYDYNLQILLQMVMIRNRIYE